MTAPELRAFVRAVLDELKDEQRGRVIDSLMARAARGDAGWKPNRPSSRIVNDARSFADAAQQVGHATRRDFVDAEKLHRCPKRVADGTAKQTTAEMVSRAPAVRVKSHVAP
jgi:hypothetical protein